MDSPYLCLKFVWRQLELAFFGATTSVVALFDLGEIKMNFFKELGQNPEKREAFNKKTKGTVLSLLSMVNSIPCLLMLISFFLPICKINFFNHVESFAFSDLLAESSSTLLTYFWVYVLCIAPLAIYTMFKIKLINETTEKKVAYCWMYISLFGMLILTIIIASTQPHLAVLAKDLEISEKIVEVGAGSVMLYVSTIIVSIVSIIDASILLLIFEGKINIDEMPKFLDLDFLFKKVTPTKEEKPVDQVESSVAEKEHHICEIKNVADEMRELKKLLDEGIITEEEFEEKKKQILDL